MNSDVKRLLASLLFGCSLGFACMALSIKLGLPDHVGIKTFFGLMPALWVINFRNKIFK